jgi:membrane protein implicated in regulation of membrane protease activity
MRYVEIEI